MNAGRAASIAGALLVLGCLPATPSRAEEPTELIGYDAVASGQAFTAFPSVPALLPVEVPFEGTVSLATATLSSGGQGFGRASTFFPGTPITGIRPLIEIASGQRLPIPDYPIVVESREFEPAKHNEQPGITMSSDVDPDRAVAIADAGGMSLPGVLTVRSSRTVSTSLHEPLAVSAESVSTVTGIDIGGVVKIDTVRSVSSVASDSVTATCDGAVTATGVTVNDQAATVDSEGLHVGEDQAVPVPGLGDAAGALDASGITVRVLGGSGACTGANGSRSTGGLLVSVPLPGVGAVPPGGRIEVILASTSATAGASTFGGFEAPPFEAPPVVGDIVHQAPGPASGGSLSPIASPGAPTEPERAPVTGNLSETDEIAYSFGGVPAPMLVGLTLLAIPGGRRVRRYVERITSLVGAP